MIYCINSTISISSDPSGLVEVAASSVLGMNGVPDGLSVAQGIGYLKDQKTQFSLSSGYGCVWVKYKWQTSACHKKWFFGGAKTYSWDDDGEESFAACDISKTEFGKRRNLPSYRQVFKDAENVTLVNHKMLLPRERKKLFSDCANQLRKICEE